MKEVTVLLTDKGLASKLKASKIEKVKYSMLIEGRFPAIVLEDDTLKILVHQQFGYLNAAEFVTLKQANIGTMPLEVMELEKYYVASIEGKLNALYE